MHVPTKGGKLHDENHLGSSDVHRAGIIENLPMYMIHGHVPHEKEEANPWHQWPVDVKGDDICAYRADKEGSDTRPQVEQSNKVKGRHRYYEEVLLIGLAIGYPFEKGGERVRSEEGEYELDFARSDFDSQLYVVVWTYARPSTRPEHRRGSQRLRVYC